MLTLVHVGLTNALAATALALLIAGLGWVCRRPALAHGLWLLVLLKLITPPLFRVPLPRPAVPGPEPVAVTHTPAEKVTAGPELNLPLPAHAESDGPSLPMVPDEVLPPEITPVPAAPVIAPVVTNWTWESVVGAAWLGGACCWWAVAALRVSRFQRLLRLARPVPPPVREQVRALAGRLGLRSVPDVRFLDASVSPLLWALWGRPCLLLPSALWSSLSREQRDTLLVHELAHLRRGDHWVRRLELLVLGLYWWHPVAWWARRELQEAEEQCCDAWVVWALPAQATAYAEALLEAVTFLSRPRAALPLGASGMGPGSCLRRRLTMILGGETSRDLSWGAALGLLGLGVLLLPFRPTWAEEEPAGEPEVKPKITRAAEEEIEVTPPPASSYTRPVPNVRMTAVKPGDPAKGTGDEVELMEAQLEVKRAEFEVAQTEIKQAQRRLERLERLRAQGVAPAGQYEAAKDELELLETRLLPRKAELREAEIRLKQAKRRLEESAKGQRVQEYRYTVTVPRTVAPQPAKPPTPPVPPVPPAPPAPAMPKVDVYGHPVPADYAKRLQTLEEKLGDLLKEMETLRKEMRPRTLVVPPPKSFTVPAPKVYPAPAEPRRPESYEAPTVPIPYRPLDKGDPNQP